MTSDKDRIKELRRELIVAKKAGKKRVAARLEKEIIALASTIDNLGRNALNGGHPNVGRKKVANPAPSTLRCRAFRERQKAGKK